MQKGGVSTEQGLLPMGLPRLIRYLPNSQITTFLTQQKSFLMKSEWGQGGDKKVGLSKEQVKFEKKDVEEVEDGR